MDCADLQRVLKIFRDGGWVACQFPERPPSEGVVWTEGCRNCDIAFLAGYKSGLIPPGLLVRRMRKGVATMVPVSEIAYEITHNLEV